MRFRRRPEAEIESESEPRPYEHPGWARPGAPGPEEDAPAVNGVTAPATEAGPSTGADLDFPDLPEYPDVPGENPYERLAAGLEEVVSVPEPAGSVEPAVPEEPEEPPAPAPFRAESPVELIGGGTTEDHPVWPPVRPAAPVEDPGSTRPYWQSDAPPYLADGAIRAAGGVVWSRWGQQLRILLIHRPKYDDWSLPKGKADPGESDSACALREVREETGLSCTLGEELATTTYTDRHGRPKTVRYWAMQPVGGSFEPHSEVDQIRWLSVDEATRLCSYQHDAEVLVSFVAAQEPPPS